MLSCHTLPTPEQGTSLYENPGSPAGGDEMVQAAVIADKKGRKERVVCSDEHSTRFFEMNGVRNLNQNPMQTFHISAKEKYSVFLKSFNIDTETAGC